MQAKTKISTGQFFIVIMLSRIMHIMVYRESTFTSGTPLMLGLVISTAIETLLAVPVFIFLMKKDDILEAAAANAKLNTALKIVLALYFTFVSGITLSLFADFMHSEFSLIASPVWIIVILAAAGAYCAYLGIEGIARAGSAVFWVFVALIVLMAFVNEGRYDPLNLTPVRKSDFKMVWEYVKWDISSSRWLPLTVALVHYLKNGAQKAAVGYLVAKFVLIGAVLLLITMVLWRFVEVPGYPILALGVYAKTDVIKQFDAVNMLVWTLNCVLVNGVYLNVASDLAKKRNVISVLVPAALACVFAILSYKNIIMLTQDAKDMIMLAGIALLGVIVPLAAIIYWRVKIKCGRSRQSSYQQ